ncbi:MAG: FecR domain-containing protein, partial [bacterium]|nr:FecR domain-containing protein [bacterium]
VSFSADTRSECYADCQVEYDDAVFAATDMATQMMYTEHATYGGTCPRVSTYGGSGSYSNMAKCLAEFLICSDGGSDCTPQLQVCCKAEAMLSASNVLSNCHSNCDYNFPDDEGDPVPGGYGDEVCPTSCINGNLYSMVYTGSGMCEVQDLTPIQSCTYGCIENSPHAGCAGAPEDYCSDFYQRFDEESCSGSTHYYDCYCDPSNGEPRCKLEDCTQGCDAQGLKCAETPSQGPGSSAECTQKSAVYTGSGCKADLRCSNTCPPSQFQLLHPSCNCFGADFGEYNVAMAVGPSMQITRDGKPLSGNRVMLEIEDKIKTTERTMVVWPDGSYFILREDSELEMDIDGFFLVEGGAWIKVEKNPDLQFTVKTETLIAGAGGTAFEVWDTGGEEGVKVIEGTVYVDIQDPETGEWYTADFPAGSIITFDKSTGELLYSEGSGQTQSSEYNALGSDASNLVSSYAGSTDYSGSGEDCCGTAFILLTALLFTSSRIRN